VAAFGIEKFKMAAVAMVTQGAKNVKFIPNFTKFFLNFINTPKASTRYGEYSYDVS
jgi:hypothetical protein